MNYFEICVPYVMSQINNKDYFTLSQISRMKSRFCKRYCYGEGNFVNKVIRITNQNHNAYERVGFLCFS